MIKKVGSNPPSKVTETKTTGIDAVKSAKVGEVSNVNQANATSKFRASTREITPELKKQLFQMIEDEAEKILAGDGISEKRKSKVKSALRMAIDAGNVSDEEKDS
jgi:hypothetical protein